MKIILISVLIIVIIVDLIRSTKVPNDEELEESENWEEINREICNKDLTSGIQGEIEKCNSLHDPYYKFDSFSKRCDKLRAVPGSNFYDQEKGECKYQECYDNVIVTQEFKKVIEELDKIPEQEKIKKSHERYECIRKALGLKV